METRHVTEYPTPHQSAAGPQAARPAESAIPHARARAAVAAEDSDVREPGRPGPEGAAEELGTQAAEHARR
ncbi:hypothetical protein, partial [Streptomyces sparsus]